MTIRPVPRVPSLRLALLPLLASLAALAVTPAAGCGAAQETHGDEPASAPGEPGHASPPACSTAPAGDPLPEEAFDPAAWSREIEAWRTRRLDRLRSEDGWLTLVGLHWMKDGTHRFGTGAENEIVLPAGAAPPRAGVLTVAGGRVTVDPAPGAEMLLEGRPVPAGHVLATDAAEKPDVLRLGRLRMHVIDRDGRLALRVKDPESSVRAAFEGVEFYPVAEPWRVVGTFEPFDEPKNIEVPTIQGTMSPAEVPGVVRFTAGGRTHTLEPIVGGPDDPDFFLIFKDDTSGSETYPAGRFLYADRVPSGPVVLDFNKAYNPPCAFTEFATCPLPPPGNVIAARIEAGEKFTSPH